MYTRILAPLDGSKTAENVLPFVRLFARNLQIPVEFFAVVDVVNMARNVYAAERLILDSLVEDEARRLGEYLSDVAKNFRRYCAVASAAGIAGRGHHRCGVSGKRRANRDGDPRTLRS